MQSLSERVDEGRPDSMNGGVPGSAQSPDDGGAVSAAAQAVCEEDLARAQWYRVFARLLAGIPSRDLLEAVGNLVGDRTPFGEAVDALADAARTAAADATSMERLSDEYHELFYGLGRGELVPYGSFYLTGFLHERPLADLRRDLGALGIERAEGVKEPEDHIAALFDVMAGGISGEFGGAFSLVEQRRFFGRHIEPWAKKFFSDLAGAQSAVMYRPVGLLGALFIELERQALQMIDEGDGDTAEVSAG